MDSNDASAELPEDKKNQVEVVKEKKIYIGPVVLQVVLVEIVLIAFLIAGVSIYIVFLLPYLVIVILLGSIIGAIFGKFAFGTRPAAYFWAILFSLLGIGFVFFGGG